MSKHMAKIYVRDGKECYLDPIRKKLIFLTPEETVRQSAIRYIIDAFDITDIGSVEVGKRANLILVEGRPDKNITDIKKIKQIWIDGKLVK